MALDHIRRGRRPASAVDTIVENFRSMIESGALRVGDDLPTERDMAEQLGVSRNTFREAIKRLEAYGIVETRQKQGARIVNKSVDAMISILSFRLGADERTFLDVQHFRGILETGLVTDIVANVTPADVEELTEINERLSASRAVVTLAEIDLAFHKRLLSIAGNDTALKVYDVLSGVILQIMTLGKAQNGSELALTSHRAIIAALAKGDRDALQRELSDHMGLGLRYLAQQKGTGS
ncbi:MAG TPA: GntR family transcriptional regulator [Devosia sp.]|jgi:DNA-binding FadR family transcriptional regulator|nr:GntR family transcriptional regulator [Devosia sp.]